MCVAHCEGRNAVAKETTVEVKKRVSEAPLNMPYEFFFFLSFVYSAPPHRERVTCRFSFFLTLLFCSRYTDRQSQV